MPNAPKLIAVAGPLKGTIFPLNSESVSIGRESSNTLCLDDPSVSRWHCVLNRNDDEFRITDLDSRNGTLVNRSIVKEQVLQNCDELQIGSSLFLFTDADEAVKPISNYVSDSTFATRTVMLRPEDSLYLAPQKLSDAIGPNQRLAEDLNALLRIATSIDSVRGLDALQSWLMREILATVPAREGAIFLAEPSGTEFTAHFCVHRDSGRKEPSEPMRAIALRILKQRCSELLQEEESRSTLGVPISSCGRFSGVLVVASEHPARMDDTHQQLLSAIAAIAASPLENAREIERLETENQRLQSEIGLRHAIVGESPKIRDLFQVIQRAAPSESTVLIRGESGTGKELVARAIHSGSARASHPFLAINCATLSETLLESELFGHEKGAFTGAVTQKRGKLEVVEGGTLFLDELGELSAALQAKLLRVLQEREFERVGGTKPIRANVRLIAATNKDLEQAVRNGTFRQDFYYRLNVITVTTPPLRERREDINLLATFFIGKHAQGGNRKVKGISATARSYLNAYDWPGNVRELENAIERAMVLGSSDWVMPEDLPEAVLEREPPEGVAPGSYHGAVKEAKKRLILSAIEQAGGNQTEAAALLGINPTYLSRLIRNLELKSDTANIKN